MAVNEPAPRGGGDDARDPQLVALIRQEIHQEINQFIISEQQLHSPESLAAYKDVDSSLPDRILGLAEREQQAHIDADLIPIRAEAFVYRVGATISAAVPALLIAVGIVLILAGKDTVGYMAAVVGVLGTGAQFVASVRPRFRGRSKQTEPTAPPQPQPEPRSKGDSKKRKK